MDFFYNTLWQQKLPKGVVNECAFFGFLKKIENAHSFSVFVLPLMVTR